MALLLSACQVKIAQSVVVDDDGSGVLTVAFGLDEQLRALVEQSGDAPDLDDPEAWREEMLDGSELPPDAEVTAFEDEDFLGIQVTVPFDRPEDLRRVFEDAAGDLAAEPMSLTVDDGRFDLRIPLDIDGFEEMVAEPDADMPFDLDGVLESLLVVEYQARLPGEVIDTNGTVAEEDPSLVTWDVDVADPSSLPAELYAVSEQPGLGWASLLGLGAVVVVLGLLAWYVLRRRAGPTPPPGESAVGVPDGPSAASDTSV